MIINKKIVVFVVCVFLLLVIIPLGFYLYSSLFNKKIHIINSSKYFKIEFTPTDQLSALLENWGVFKKNSMKLPNPKHSSSLKSIRVKATDIFDAEYTYRHYKDSSKKIIILNTSYSVDENNNATINVYISQNELRTLKPEILNYYILNGIILSLYNNRSYSSPSSREIGIRDVLEPFANNQTKNPFHVTILNM